VLCCTYFSVGIRRRTVATDSRERNAVEVKDRRRNAGRQKAKQGALLDHLIRAVDMRVGYLRVLGGLTLLTKLRHVLRRQLAKRARNIVMVGSSDLHPLGAQGKGWGKKKRAAAKQGGEAGAANEH